jgi:hypothetical protein
LLLILFLIVIFVLLFLFFLGVAAMGRVRDYIQIKGSKFWTLFDTGARNTYIIPKVAALLATSKLTKPLRSALGGSVKRAKEMALLEGNIDGHRVATHAMVIDEIGRDEGGKPVEILFGALAMQQWGIQVVPKEERLDLTHYPKEFVEF